ncbi:class I SAM-dependent methyltransferase [Haloimpatiens sp. FM7330]|uniref:class I SAM-dependent methyltransferase n=1 Tax=Haloimpatiens sp. FM7330 TaxID=3298610 RepID=UPI00363C2D23
MNKEKVNYLNWVPIKIIYFILAVVVISLFFMISSFMKLNVFSECAIILLWCIRIISTVIFGVSVYFFILLGKARHMFSYTAGRVADKILEYVLSCLKWDGNGKLLDIGCGSGALSIKCAKKYSQSKIIGIDYWGNEWDYNKKQCEINAKAEGVSNVHFQKGDASCISFKTESMDAAVSNFVFHEVKSLSDKKLVIKEALRVLKKGAPFVFHDLFFDEKYYGTEKELRTFLKELGLKEVKLEKTEELKFIPRSLVKPVLLKGIGIIYGIK